ncbi:MAG: hypothetical protein OEZ01_15310 [Candidatus Heimdallarchaeota archaeon]|nr:hypothetical protein [Candidatus Heimdallarchaeota archaeon]
MEKQRLEQPVTQQQFEWMKESYISEKLANERRKTDEERAEKRDDRILKAISDSENKTMKAISDSENKTMKAISDVKTDLEKDILGMKWWTVRTFGGLLMLFSSIIVGAIKLLPTAVHIVEKIPH